MSESMEIVIDGLGRGAFCYSRGLYEKCWKEMRLKKNSERRCFILNLLKKVKQWWYKDHSYQFSLLKTQLVAQFTSFPKSLGLAFGDSVLLALLRSVCLRKRFKAVCGSDTSTRKKSVKVMYCRAVGYSSITASRVLTQTTVPGNMQNNDIEDAYEKLYRVLGNSSRDASFCQTALLVEICVRRMETNPMNLVNVEGV